MEFLKDKKKTAIIGGITGIAVILGSITIHANAAMSVSAYTVDRGPLDKVIEVNGNVDAESSTTYYSQIDGKIGEVLVKEGDFVKKGDLLVSYDQAKLDRQIALVDYRIQSGQGSYDDSMQQGSRVAGLYSEAKRNLSVLDQQITDTQAAITQTQNDIMERRAALADEGAKLQISLIDWADKPDSDEYENLQKLVQSNAYEQQYGQDIVQMQEELNRLNVQLEACKEYKAEMTSQKASTVTGLMTQGARDQLEAVRASNEVINADEKSRYEAAKAGIKSDFDGVVTDIYTINGSMVNEGSPLVKVDSTEDIVLKLNINKYDIVDIEEGQSATVNIKNKEYTGKVSRIERITSKDAIGVGVEVTLDEPDSDIILGLECKVKITAASLDNVLRIPMDAYCTDEKGDYVFVLRDNKAVKTYVETGVKNNTMIEIISGIGENDQVLWNDETELTDGMEVKVK